MAEKGVRIRLKFQDAGILSKQQIDQGLAQCWHLVRFDDVRTIDDVASDISSIFSLGESCPNGLGLEVDGFVLPTSQSAQLLKDSDLVRIRRKVEPPITPRTEVPRDVRKDEPFLINGYRYASYGGLELRAIDEFEKETGGYKSEEEEGEMETDTSLDGGARTLGETKLAPIFLKDLERSGKKRKRAKDPGTEAGKSRRSPGNGLPLSLANAETKEEKHKANKVSRRTGVNLRALDEFEGELGGYESEQEEDENEEETDFSLGGTKNVIPFEVRSLGTPREEKRTAKKHKLSKKDVEIRDDIQMQQLKMAVNDIDGEAEDAIKKKRKKNPDVNVSRHTEDGLQLSPVKGKDRKNSRRADKAEDLLRKDEKLGAPPESSRKKRLKEKSKIKLVSSPEVGDDSSMRLENTAMDSDNHEDGQRNENRAAQDGETNLRTPGKDSKSIPGDDAHRPSRSARRKKAKRKWLREQQAKTANLSTEEDVIKSVPSHEQTVEVDTGEDVLPVVVRAGHIRFEPYEEDLSGHPPRASLPVLNLLDQPISKRQGQNWGQEKTAKKQKGKGRIKESADDASFDANACSDGERTYNGDLDKLPSLPNAPQCGDVIAYRLVELTTSWTPELSSHRVGVVASVDSKTNMIKLAPHPDYPFCLRDAEVDEGADMESELYPLPYDADGNLETEISALVDVRLLKKKTSANCPESVEETEKQVSGYKKTGPLEDGPSIQSRMPEIVERLDIVAPSNAQVANETEVFVKEGSAQTRNGQLNSTTPSGGEKGTDNDAMSLPDWQTQLTKELQRKKLEIRQKFEDSGSNKTSVEPERKIKAVRGRKFLKSAGVGTIVALLRAQQAL
ncbi:coilin [Marchantia polymorpha subsp. ruderalis]|uniref:Coilin n=2 Tax=Marchantia polymorpha TaxID=3197 RepID=A0AAF6BL53_MARPO|nr:hypothetical protein MARPO_0010s0205 [Marchantia polymorpha]BBN12737.1 hypothetical protein Mp_5g22520 [Marchantia polymorpha subsp. ruderalis]|eukprot:PTQ46843.1 hypothetical protein MARPO_0010s0205 [Marchantia polymorpha]